MLNIVKEKGIVDIINDYKYFLDIYEKKQKTLSELKTQDRKNIIYQYSKKRYGENRLYVKNYNTGKITRIFEGNINLKLKIVTNTMYHCKKCNCLIILSNAKFDFNNYCNLCGKLLCGNCICFETYKCYNCKNISL